MNDTYMFYKIFVNSGISPEEAEALVYVFFSPSSGGNSYDYNLKTLTEAGFTGKQIAIFEQILYRGSEEEDL